MVDSTDSVEWEEIKNEFRELSAQACKTQALSGRYFLGQTTKSKALGLIILEKNKKIGGNHVTIGDHRVWANSDVIRRRMPEEKVRKASRESEGLRSTHENLWDKCSNKRLNNNWTGESSTVTWIQLDTDP